MHPPLSFFLQRYSDHRDLHSFPTRRSSDLWKESWNGSKRGFKGVKTKSPNSRSRARCWLPRKWLLPSTARRLSNWKRSEEHTSELQSHVNLVCRLLLEKKKTD